jgi:hypothetical protein
MENNNQENIQPSEAPHVEAPHVEPEVEANVEAPAEAPAEAVVEPVAEPVVEAPVVEAPVVEAPAAEEPVQSLGFTKTGAIGSMAADGPKKEPKAASVDISEKVALHSTKSVRWEEVGAISRGYNIVTKAQADKWLTRKHVRIATPEEVKKAFG